MPTPRLYGDMRSLRLPRQFDVVLIHDAIMYATGPADVQAALRTAAIHAVMLREQAEA